MQTIAILLTIGTFVLVGSTLLCGLWLKSKGATPEGVAFHGKLAISTSIFTLITVLALVFHV